MILWSVHVANASMLYLIVVLAAAIWLGRGPAILASVAAFLTFNWFFTNPRQTFIVADPAEWVALILFLLTAVAAGQLAADQRRQSIEARQREHEAVVLSDVVRLVSDPDLDRALSAVAEKLRRELRSSIVAIEIADGDFARVFAHGGDPVDLAAFGEPRPDGPRLPSAGPLPSVDRTSVPDRGIGAALTNRDGRRRTESTSRELLHAVPIRTQDRQVGSLIMLREVGAPSLTRAEDRLLSAVASQLGQTVERARLRHEATEAEILRRTDELRKVLLNAVSHDLRTPLSSIVAGSESLLQLDGPSDSGWSEDDRREFAQSIRTEALRLNRIVENLLDLSRIEAGSIRPRKDWHDLRILVADVLGRLRPLTEPRVLTLDAPDDLPPVALDHAEIDQVLSNLVENAVKHTPDGTPIEISLRLQEDEAVVEVADHGPGVPLADLQHLFESFYRGDSARSGSRGSGLGLAVVRGLIEAHGGRVWAENVPDAGARFGFALPIGPAVLPAGNDAPDDCSPAEAC